METILFLCATPPNWFVYASGLASLFALIFVILYFVKPNLEITDDSNYSNQDVRIKCVNRNIFRNAITDIKCDIVASETSNFEISDTQELYKDWTPGIRFNDNYVFKIKSVPTTFRYKKYLKVRILTVNVLGIRKLFEKVFEIR